MPCHQKGGAAPAPGESCLGNHKNSSWRQRIWPSWTRAHPWYDVLPLHHIWFTHSKQHYSGQDRIGDCTAGALTVLTQGSKCLVALLGFALGREEDTWERVHLWSMVGFLGLVAPLLYGVWVRKWGDLMNCTISILAWITYINGWTLAILVLYRRLPERLGLPAEVGLVIALGPPLYITVRTALFGFLKPGRRLLFPLAALSNRSVPIDLNYHIVGPKATWNSHRMLVMLNCYAASASFLAKFVAILLDPDQVLVPGLLIQHVFHLITTVYAALYGIRCRQIALDHWADVEEAEGGQHAGVGAGEAIKGKADASNGGGAHDASNGGGVGAQDPKPQTDVELGLVELEKAKG